MAISFAQFATDRLRQLQSPEPTPSNGNGNGDLFDVIREQVEAGGADQVSEGQPRDIIAPVISGGGRGFTVEDLPTRDVVSPIRDPREVPPGFNDAIPDPETTQPGGSLPVTDGTEVACPTCGRGSTGSGGAALPLQTQRATGNGAATSQPNVALVVGIGLAAVAGIFIFMAQ